jgi:hypothetical protein
MPASHPDERSLRDTITRLRDIYDRARHRLTALTTQVTNGAARPPQAADLAAILTEVHGADDALRQLVEAWSRTQTPLRRALSNDVESLRQSAASCLALVSTAEREYGRQREQVVTQLDEGVTRNRAVRAYSHAMRQ